jgi:hypothetical protein
MACGFRILPTRHGWSVHGTPQQTDGEAQFQPAIECGDLHGCVETVRREPHDPAEQQGIGGKCEGTSDEDERVESEKPGGRSNHGVKNSTPSSAGWKFRAICMLVSLRDFLL